MSTPNERLRDCRIACGYDTTEKAALAMGVPHPTYRQHEGGQRNITVETARRYARFFRTAPEWILYGRRISTEPTEAELEEMIADCLSEILTVDTRIADLPRILSASLHEQLERFRADRTDALHGGSGARHGRFAQSNPPTTLDG